MYSHKGVFPAHPHVHDGSCPMLSLRQDPDWGSPLSLSPEYRRTRDVANNMLDLQASVPKWCMLLLMFHWPEQVLWPHDDRFGAHNSPPGRLHRRGEIQSTTVGYLPIQTHSNARGVDSHEVLLIGWPWAFLSLSFILCEVETAILVLCTSLKRGKNSKEITGMSVVCKVYSPALP